MEIHNYSTYSTVLYYFTALFKIESQDEHSGGGAVDTFSINALLGVLQVFAVFFEYVTESETKLQFRYEFEKRQIKVAAQAGFKHEIEGLGA